MSPRIMVVDDEKDLACLFEKYLQRSGFDCNSFTSPLSALKHFEQNRYSNTIIITDLIMPSLDGIRFANKIREINDKVDIVLLSAYPIHDYLDDSDFMAARFSQVLLKPLKLSELRQRIEMHVYIETSL